MSQTPVADQAASTRAQLERRLRRAESERDELRATLDEVQRTGELFRSVVRDQTDFVVRWLPDYTRTFVNDAYCREFGQSAEELVGTSFMPLVHDQHREAVEAKIASLSPERPVASGRHRVLKPGGVVSWHHWVDRGIFDDAGELIELQSVGRDITDQVRLESQLRETQKAEALGRLAAGLAHDFNNLLTVIMAASRLAREAAGGDPQLRDLTTEISDAAELAGDLTRQLLAFSRRQLLELSVFALNDIVGDYEPMMRRIVPDDIEFELDLDPEAGVVRADRTQVGRVLINLVSNSVDAMPDGGRLTVSTSRARSANGAHAAISVRDTGCGIPAHIEERIFDPFFTTKEFGGGNGLGLSSVRGIIAQHGGTVTVDSTVCVGTTVSVTLPRAEGPIDRPDPESTATSPAGRVTILVLDDNEAVLQVVVRTLQLDGHRVFAALTGEEAVRIAADNEIDVLVTDVILRGASGPTVYEALAAERSDLRVVYMSGYADEVVETKGGLEGRFLHKPFSPPELRARLAETLGRPVS